MKIQFIVQNERIILFFVACIFNWCPRWIIIRNENTSYSEKCNGIHIGSVSINFSFWIWLNEWCSWTFQWTYHICTKAPGLMIDKLIQIEFFYYLIVIRVSDFSRISKRRIISEISSFWINQWLLLLHIS